MPCYCAAAGEAHGYRAGLGSLVGRGGDRAVGWGRAAAREDCPRMLGREAHTGMSPGEAGAVRQSLAWPGRRGVEPAGAVGILPPGPGVSEQAEEDTAAGMQVVVREAESRGSGRGTAVPAGGGRRARAGVRTPGALGGPGNSPAVREEEGMPAPGGAEGRTALSRGPWTSYGRDDGPCAHGLRWPSCSSMPRGRCRGRGVSSFVWSGVTRHSRGSSYCPVVL